MMDKRTTRRKRKIESKIESKHVVDFQGVVVGSITNHIEHHERSRFDVAQIAGGILTMVISIALNLVLELLSSGLPRIQQPYASLIGIVVSSGVGISVVFLLARFISQKRRAEMQEVIQRVRSKERRLFELLDLDFDSITNRKELNAG